MNCVFSLPVAGEIHETIVTNRNHNAYSSSPQPPHHASTATRELDDLMASLSDFKVSAKEICCSIILGFAFLHDERLNRYLMWVTERSTGPIVGHRLIKVAVEM